LANGRAFAILLAGVSDVQRIKISRRAITALAFAAFAAVALVFVLFWRADLAQRAEARADTAAAHVRTAGDATVRLLLAMRERDTRALGQAQARLNALAANDPTLAEEVATLIAARNTNEIGIAAIALIDAAHARATFYEAAGDRIDTQGDMMVWVLGPLLAAAILLAVAALLWDWRRVRASAAELSAARARAEENAAVKTFMLAAASHDVRQPLHAMSLLLSALRRRVETDEQKHILGRIEEAAAALRRLFSSLLDVARLEAGIVKADPHAFALEPLLKQLVDEAGEIAATAGAQVTLAPAPFTLDTDPQLLEAIVRNLLSNAVKVSPGGAVRVSAEAEGARVRIDVRDSGAALDAAALDRLLAGHSEPNVRVGLGLFIVREMAKILSLDVRARTAPGGGAIVSVTAPAATATQAETATI